MAARVTEKRRLRELYPAGSLASPPSVTRKRTRYMYITLPQKPCDYKTKPRIMTELIVGIVTTSIYRDENRVV
jgi:hypothetical protein